jgi:hypothetical protein
MWKTKELAILSFWGCEVDWLPEGYNVVTLLCLCTAAHPSCPFVCFFFEDWWWLLFSHQGWDTVIAQEMLRLLHTDMTIHWKLLRSTFWCTLPSQWFLAPARLYAISTTATDGANSEVSSKEDAVIGAVLGTRKFHRGHHWHQTHE